jgi:hypothetical protein
LRTPVRGQTKPQTTHIPVVTLPSPDLVRQLAMGKYPAAAQAVLKPVVESQLPPAGSDTAGRIKHLIDIIASVLDPEQTFTPPPPATPETEPGVLSDTYFGIARDSSGCPFTTQAKAALRALHSALVDIQRNGTTLTEIELGNLLKLPYALGLFASESPTQETY